jgi:(2Fe-2S) ferredoxin
VSPPPRRIYRITICRGPECGERRGSAALTEAFRACIQEAGLREPVDVQIDHQACFGRCRQGPNVLVRLAPVEKPKTLLATAPSGPGQNAALYNGVTVGDVGKIIESHVGKGMIVRELIRRPDVSTSTTDPKPSGDSGERK